MTTTYYGSDFMRYKARSSEEYSLIEIGDKDWSDCGDFTLKRYECKPGEPKTPDHDFDLEHVFRSSATEVSSGGQGGREMAVVYQPEREVCNWDV